MVLRIARGLSLDTIHSAFRHSKFEILNMKEDVNIADLSEEEQTAAADDHETVEAARRLVEEFSTLRVGQTAVHPEPNPKQWPPPEGPNRERPTINCLRHLFSEVLENDELLCQDCVLLTNRVQRHKCNKRYCLKSLTPALQICKFSYPKALQGFEAEQQGDSILAVANKMEEMEHQTAHFEGSSLALARNHPRLVEHIQEILQGWRGNCNVQIVKSLEQLLQYVVKYMLKASTGSASFHSTIKDITEQQGDDTRAASVFQKVLMRQITEHDMPRTEAARIVSGRPFVFYSRPFKMVNLMGVRRVVVPQSSEHDPTEAGQGLDRRATQDNIADMYWVREERREYLDLVERYEAGSISLPWHPKDVSLYLYAAHFERSWCLASQTYVPHVSPMFRYIIITNIEITAFSKLVLNTMGLRVALHGTLYFHKYLTLNPLIRTQQTTSRQPSLSDLAGLCILFNSLSYCDLLSENNEIMIVHIFGAALSLDKIITIL